MPAERVAQHDGWMLLDTKLENLLRLTARLYHIDGLSQTEIAGLIGASRPKVSRLLARAQNEGIVRVVVEEFDPRNQALEDDLSRVFGLNHAVVIRIVGETDIESVRNAVGYLAAPYVSNWIIPNAIVGLSGSRSLYHLIQYMKAPTGTRGVVVMQMMGNIGANVSHYDSIELSRTLADSFYGSYYMLNAPAIAPDLQSWEIFMAHHDVRTIWALLSAMQIAFVGIGSLTHSSFIERGVITPDIVDRLRERGAVGEVCGRFYNSYGEECAVEYQERVVGIRLSELRTIPEVVGVTARPERAEAVLAALRGGLIKSLVIDEAGAEAVLALAASRVNNLSVQGDPG